MYTLEINTSERNRTICLFTQDFAKRIVKATLRLAVLSVIASSGLANEPQLPAVSSDLSVKNDTAFVENQLLNRLKANDSARVVMHAKKPDARLARQLESLLLSLGLDNVELRYVDQVPDKVQVRFYHRADSEAGQAVADVLALVFDEVAARDFKNYQPLPSAGLIEIWLP